MEIAESDWGILRSEGRTLPNVLSGCTDPDFSYTKFDAQVSITGENVSNVAVRNKVFLGSMSAFKPSIKLDFGRGDNKDRKFYDAWRITFNNNRQDPSNVRQCVVYDLFSRAGLPAPLCGLANVQVNGIAQGILVGCHSLGLRLMALSFSLLTKGGDGALGVIGGGNITFTSVGRNNGD